MTSSLFFTTYEPTRSAAMVAMAVQRDQTSSNQKYLEFINSVPAATDLDGIPVERHLYKIVRTRTLISKLSALFLFNDPQNLANIFKLSSYRHVVLPKFRNLNPPLYSDPACQDVSVQSYDRENSKIFSILQRIHSFLTPLKTDPLLDAARESHHKLVTAFHKMEFFQHPIGEGPFLGFDNSSYHNSGKTFIVWYVSAFNGSSVEVIRTAVKSMLDPTKFYLLELEHQRLEKIDQILKQSMGNFDQPRLISDYLFADEDLVEYYQALAQPEAMSFVSHLYDDINTKIREYRQMALTFRDQLRTFGSTVRGASGIAYQMERQLDDFTQHTNDFQRTMLNYHFKENIAASELEEQTEFMETYADSLIEDFPLSKVPEKRKITQKRLVDICVIVTNQEIAENKSKIQSLVVESQLNWNKLEDYFVSKKMIVAHFKFKDIFSTGNTYLVHLHGLTCTSDNFFVESTEFHSALKRFEKLFKILEIALIALNFVIAWEDEKSDTSVPAAEHLRKGLYDALHKVKYYTYIDDRAILSDIEKSFDVACSIYLKITTVPKTPPKTATPKLNGLKTLKPSVSLPKIGGVQRSHKK